MKVRISMAAGALLMAAVAARADSPSPFVTAKTGDVEISARLITDRDAQLKAVGSDLNRQYVIVELTVTPRGRYPVTLSRDDFLLRSARDNERATADSPERIAGSSVLVLGSRSTGRPIYSQSGDPVYVGGLPGTGTGPPRRIGAVDDTYGAGAGGGAATVSASTAKVTPLLSALREKELRVGETRKPVSGFLYFPVDPKQKTKNFYLHFKGPGGGCELRFK